MMGYCCSLPHPPQLLWLSIHSRRQDGRHDQGVIHRGHMVAHSDERPAGLTRQRCLYVLPSLHGGVVDASHEATACVSQDVHDCGLWAWPGGRGRGGRQGQQQWGQVSYRWLLAGKKTAHYFSKQPRSCTPKQPCSCTPHHNS